ncbi:MAG: HD domain-containing protein [Spirochaetaceae bacterium]|jgi:putative nucleotidyltransferase with HDIG domain|nr:HD domain-containing protein [Spirochaetaceae bacterium]
MGNLRIHPLLREMAYIFTGAGKEVYLVGGAVRDIFLGRDSADWDLATNARPEEVMGLFKRVIPTGIRHGTVTVRHRGLSVEVTTFRTESQYSDGRRPDTIQYASTIEEDLSRRDFTMNAAAVRLPEGRIVDPFDGHGDIRRRLIRCVGRAEERFAEDGLRPMRAVRFAAQLGFDLEDKTLAAIPGALDTTAKVAPERLREELDKTIAAPMPQTGFIVMEETGLLKLILPELDACRGVEQRGYHRYDVLDHSLFACAYAAKKGFSTEVRMAALFHDLGKPAAARKDEERGIWTFYKHEQESVRLTEGILRRLRYPNAVIERVLRLIREHMFHYEETWNDAAVRRFIIRAGEDLIPCLLQLRLADSAGTLGIEPDPAILLPFRRRIEASLAKTGALSLKDLAVNGRDLMAAGVAPGRHVGIILGELLEAVVEDPDLNTREKLLEIAGNINKRYQEKPVPGDPHHPGPRPAG